MRGHVLANLADDAGSEVSETLIRRAEAALREMTRGFAHEAGEQVGRLDAAYEALSGAGANAGIDASLAPYFDEAFEASHELVGQAGSFGYALLAHVCESLCVVIERRDCLPRAAVDAIGEHIATIHLILDRGLKGDGGEIGSALMRDLSAIHRRIALRRPPAR